MTVLDRAKAPAASLATFRSRSKARRHALAALLITSSLVGPLAAREALARDERTEVLPSGHGKALYSNTWEVQRPSFSWGGYRPFAITFFWDFSNGDPNVREYQLAAPLIENTGADASAWYWWYDQTPESLAGHLKEVGGRLLSLHPYHSGPAGGIRYLGLFVPNTGAEKKNWWWHPALDKAGITAMLAAHNARLIDLHQREDDGLYSVVMIENTGADYQDSHWDVGVSIDEVNAQVQAHHGRLTRLAAEANVYTVRGSAVGSWDYIMEPAGGKKWWWFVNKEGNDIDALMTSLHARVVDIEAHNEVTASVDQTFYSVILLGNSD
jgi:hypothetical protein